MSTTHQCPANGCTEMVPFNKLMCPEHWSQVPADLQERVYRAWKRGTLGEHLKARTEAIRSVNGTVGGRLGRGA